MTKTIMAAIVAVGLVGCESNDGWDVHLATAHAYAVQDLEQGKLREIHNPNLDTEMEWLTRHNDTRRRLDEVSAIQLCQLTMLNQRLEWIVASMTTKPATFDDDEKRDIDRCIETMSHSQ